MKTSPEQTKILEKKENGIGRISFPEKCVENDVLLDFLKLRALKIDFFSDQALRGFQLRLLKTELKKARENKANLDTMADMSRSELYCALKENCSVLWPSTNAYISREIDEQKLRLNAKLKTLAERQTGL